MKKLLMIATLTLFPYQAYAEGTLKEVCYEGPKIPHGKELYDQCVRICERQKPEPMEVKVFETHPTPVVIDNVSCEQSCTCLSRPKLEPLQ